MINGGYLIFRKPNYIIKINPIANPITETGVAHTFGNISAFHPPFCLYFRVSCGSITWTCMKEAYKGFSVYKDFIKDLVYLMLIVQALGGISVLLASSDWTFANTVSIHYFKSKNCFTKGLIISEGNTGVQQNYIKDFCRSL